MHKIIILVSVVVCFSSCRYGGKRMRGNGHTATVQRSVTGFTAVETLGSIDVVVSNGPYKVSVKGDENLLPYVIIESANNRLTVQFKKDMSFTDVGDITVYVTAPDINIFVSHGSGNITGEGRLANTNKIQVNTFGSGDIDLQLDCPDIATEIHGSGNTTFSGETRNFSGEIHGSGDINAAHLKAEHVTMSVHASGDASVFASESLDAAISGSGDIHYRGEPKISSSVHGSGEVTRMD